MVINESTKKEPVLNIAFISHPNELDDILMKCKKANIKLFCAHCGCKIYNRREWREPKGFIEKSLRMFGQRFYVWDTNIGLIGKGKIYCNDPGCTLNAH